MRLAVLQNALRELAARAQTDALAQLELGGWSGLCHGLHLLADSSDDKSRLEDPQWKELLDVCTEDVRSDLHGSLQSAAPEVIEELVLAPWSNGATTAEQFAERDRRMESLMRDGSRPARAFNAAVLYFDYERFAQWAGGLRPPHILDQRSYQYSRIGLDIAWMYGCRLGMDCGPFAGFTLGECWATPGCVPGGGARQVVQMRRSPLELRLVDLMVDRLLRGQFY